METDHVSVHQSAWIAVDALQPGERETSFRRLSASAPSPRQNGHNPGRACSGRRTLLYSLRVTPDLHVFFSVTGPNHLEIEDLVRPETLELHFRPRVEKAKRYESVRASCLGCCPCWM